MVELVVYPPDHSIATLNSPEQELCSVVVELVVYPPDHGIATLNSPEHVYKLVFQSQI